MRTSRRPVVVHMALLFALSLLVGSAAVLAGPSDAGAATRKITIKVQYEAPSCPSGKESMQPLPGAKLLVKFGSRTIKEQLDDRGVASLNLKGKAKELTAKVVLDGDLLAVSPYGKQAPYSYVDDLKLTDKKTYGLKIKELEKAGAASAWAILSGGAKLGKASAPAGVDLGKIVARYDSGRGPTAGLPDLPGTETAYDGDKSEIVIDSRTRADEFEPWVLNHEYGHHVLEKVATPGPSGAGAHDLERSYPSQPALPWSEGFAHAFAAIVAKNPVLGTLCRTGVNIGSSPATPASQDGDHLNQYHEISVAGVLWALANRFGGGNVQAGLKRLLAAFKIFHGAYGGPESLREARDALISGGLETTVDEHQELTELFARQQVGWAFAVQLEKSSEGENPDQADYLSVRADGPPPYGACDENGEELPSGDIRGANGALDYAWQDDCYTLGQAAGTINALYVPYPAPGARGNPEETFTVHARWDCEVVNTLPDSAPCPSQRGFEIFIWRGRYSGGDPASCFGCLPSTEVETWGAEHSVESASLADGVWTPIAEFDALGRCKSLVDGADCGL